MSRTLLEGLTSAARRLFGRAAKPSDGGIPRGVNRADTLWEEEDYRAVDTVPTPVVDAWVQPLDTEPPPVTARTTSTGRADDDWLPGFEPAPCTLPLFNWTESREPFGESRPESAADEIAPADTPVESAHALEDAVAPGETQAPRVEADDGIVPDSLELLDDEWAGVEQEATAPASPADLDDLTYADVDLPDFDPAARVDPWEVEEADDEPARRKARTKAAALASQLDLVTSAKVAAAVDYLSDLYLRHPYGATHRALMHLAANGLDRDTLEAMVALRDEWATRREWWLHRTGGMIRRSDACRTAMTWRLALEVCRSRADHPPECMIDDDWVDEWFALRPGEPGYLRFAEFVAIKVDADSAGALFEGLQQSPGDHRDAPKLDDI